MLPSNLLPLDMNIVTVIVFRPILLTSYIINRSKEYSAICGAAMSVHRWVWKFHASLKGTPAANQRIWTIVLHQN